MADQKAVEYLRQNQALFTLEVLEENLRKSGYPQDVIDEALKEVNKGTTDQSATSTVKPSFWDFKTKRIYLNRKEKILDILLGFFGVIIVSWVINLSVGFLLSLFHIGTSLFYIPIIISLILFILEIILIIYFFKKRKFVAFGMMINFIFGIVILFLGVASLLFFRGFHF